jgi:hypothetical protein
MRKLDIAASAAAIAFLFNAGVVAAQIMSKSDYKSRRDGIAADYRSARANCGALSGNAKDVCMAEAKGKDGVARAELELEYKPSPKTHYYLSIARANADYAVAKEKCDDRAGNDRKVCLENAKAERSRARAEAMRGR